MTLARPAKPAKPHKDFPLFAHATRRWAKKVGGKLHYFGPWDDPDGALRRWLERKDYLLSGQLPPTPAAGVTVGELANRYIDAQRARVERGELSPRTLAKYFAVANLVVATFGGRRVAGDLRPADFANLRTKLCEGTRSHEVRGDRIQIARSIFVWGDANDLMPSAPRFGTEFRRPSADVIRQAIEDRPRLDFSAEEVRALLKVASVPMRTMILLAINAAYGPTDCAELRLDHLDLKAGFVTKRRHKRGRKRQCAALWPETVEAIKLAIAERPSSKDADHDGLVFVTSHGRPWVRASLPEVPQADGKLRVGSVDAVALEFARIRTAAGIEARGRGFYSLRRTFRTVADTLDRGAVDLVMGHGRDPGDMGSRYMQGDMRDRLRSVADAVRGWLVAGAEGGAL